MAAVYEWVRNITYFMIFITVVGNLLADSKYEKYLRFFAGMVLILLVLKPLTGSLRLDERIAYLFEAISFQKEADDFKEKLWGMEDERLSRVIDTYQGAVAMDLRGMAETAGFSARAVKVTIETNRDSPLYGHVTDLYMKLGSLKETAQGGNVTLPEYTTEPAVSSDITIPQQQIQVETVRLGGEGAERTGDGQTGGEEAAKGGEEPAEEAAMGQTFPADIELRAKINAFIRKVAGYYGLETAHIQVEWEDD